MLVLVPLESGHEGLVQQRKADVREVEQFVAQWAALLRHVADPRGDAGADTAGAGAADDNRDPVAG
ncbi:hypothetical protein P3G67_14065 [Streptomyces sp. RB6PN23]|uniref:Uncharacterized protein n=1 Tax=Streptomyces silvisoli TaxID=3034235 RepID=A0ABT5ZL73_9ACTN|nr:hypothetical protein [Streptomyces silvisoli]MDF3290349.1 hypothetical protein [Streptomyces silvisoli]